MKDERKKKHYDIKGECSLKLFIQEKLNNNSLNQMDFIVDTNGNIPLDFIGRFDNLHHDFSMVCKEIGIEDSKLPRLLISGNDHYINYFNNETKDLIYKIYKEEINYFNFEFGE